MLYSNPRQSIFPILAGWGGAADRGGGGGSYGRIPDAKNHSRMRSAAGVLYAGDIKNVFAAGWLFALAGALALSLCGVVGECLA